MPVDDHDDIHDNTDDNENGDTTTSEDEVDDDVDDTNGDVNEQNDDDDDDDDVDDVDEDGDENGDDDNQETELLGGSSFVESMLGGAPPEEEEEEELAVDHNKKIVHHDEVLLLHPESRAHNYDEIHKASLVTRNDNNIIVDKLHTSMPILTKYEKAKILGQRTKQLNEGSEPFITWDRPTMDNSLIAEEELMQKKLPFIIQRPLPSGGFEYWHVKDLEVLRDM